MLTLITFKDPTSQRVTTPVTATFKKPQERSLRAKGDGDSAEGPPKSSIALSVPKWHGFSGEVQGFPQSEK